MWASTGFDDPHRSYRNRIHELDEGGNMPPKNAQAADGAKTECSQWHFFQPLRVMMLRPMRSNFAVKHDTRTQRHDAADTTAPYMGFMMGEYSPQCTFSDTFHKLH